MDLESGLLTRIDAYLARSGMPATTFGRLAVGDGNFVSRLRAGRSPTLRTHARIDAFLRAPPPAPYRSMGAGRGAPNLAQVIGQLRARRTELETAGIAHAAVFGSVARGKAHADSDIDILIDTAPSRPLGLFALAGLKRRITEIVPRADVVDRRSLHPDIAAHVLDEAVYAF
jgi:predicted nucleotidyltransferase